jgi:starch-binding outer membrane protein, SusD/RagB family
MKQSVTSIKLLNKLLKMKNIICYIIVLYVLLTSCSDSFLDTSAPSKQSSENVFNSTFFAEAAIEGIYSVFATSNCYSNKFPVYYFYNSDIECNPGVSSSSLNTMTNDVAMADYYTNNTYSNNGTWTSLYSVVEMSAVAIDGLRNSIAITGADSAVMKAHLGEALTLRALAYFDLVKLWGDVPFRTGVVDGSTTYAAKTDRDTIYKYIINDLLEAANYLPWMGKTIDDVSFTCERVTKGYAKALAAKIALYAGGWSVRDANTFSYQETSLKHKSDVIEMNNCFVGRVKNYLDYYQIALEQCADIIGSSDNPHALDPSYEDVWYTVNQLNFNSYNEDLFEVAMGMGENSDIGNIIGMALDKNTTLSNSGRGLGGTSYLGGNYYYFYSFDSLDDRRDITLTNLFYTASTSTKNEGSKYLGSVGSEGFGLVNSLFPFTIGKWRFTWMTDAYMALVIASTGGRVGTGINYVDMRYSDVLLMFAEAMNELYGPDVTNQTAGMTARNALEKVRTRAFSSHPSEVSNYSSDFFQAIVNERAWEFGGEGLRKFDLIRWGILSEKLDAARKAMCLMLDGDKDVTIFDKTYAAGSLPTTLYFDYNSGKNTINMSSISWYGNVTTTAYSIAWLGGALGGTSLAANQSKILVQNSGLDATFDPSSIINQLDSASSVSSYIYQNFPNAIGNSYCNSRHFMAINYSLLLVDEPLVNSYGW